MLAKASGADYDAAWATPSGGGGGGGATDHGDLTGLADDDHAQYHTDARGDARYARRGVSRWLGTPTLYLPGRYYDASFAAVTHTTVGGVAGRLEMCSIAFWRDVPIDIIGVNVTSNIANARGRVAIYEANADGWPDALAYYGTEDLIMSTAGFKYHELAFTFLADRLYWIGLHHSSTANVTGIQAGALRPNGLNSATVIGQASAIQRTIAFASGAPDPWGFSVADLATNVSVPSVRFRVV